MAQPLKKVKISQDGSLGLSLKTVKASLCLSKLFSKLDNEIGWLV